MKHTMIYTVGAKKSFNISDKCKALLIFEWNDFEMSQDFQLQWNYMGYYGHHQVKEGFTQKGQMLAGAYSYFGDSQLLKFQLFFPKSNYLLPVLTLFLPFFLLKILLLFSLL